VAASCSMARTNIKRFASTELWWFTPGMTAKDRWSELPIANMYSQSDKLQTHYSQSRLGHSYSFWVPWDAAGGPLQHLTLISRFVSNDGTELTAAPAHVVLQGPGELSPFQNEIVESKLQAEKKSIAKNRLRSPAGSGIQQVGYEVEESEADDQRSSTPARHPGSADVGDRSHQRLLSTQHAGTADAG
jgi:hypothetical protein